VRTSVSAAILTTDKFVFVENLKLHADMELSAMTSAFIRRVSMGRVDVAFEEYFDRARFTYCKNGEVRIITSEREKKLMEEAFIAGNYFGQECSKGLS
jgi:hypothetical protein